MKILFNNNTLISVPSKIILLNTNNTYYKLHLAKKVKYYDKLFAYDYINRLKSSEISNIKIVINDIYNINDFISKYNIEKDEYDENIYHLYTLFNKSSSKQFNVGWFIGNL